MAKHRQAYRTSRNISQYLRSSEVVDMEVDCVFCNTRLYVPDTALKAVLDSLRRVGGAVLVCHMCGQAQLVSRKMPSSQYVHD